MQWKRIPGIYWMHQLFWNAHSATWDEATDTDEYSTGLERMTQALAERSTDRTGAVLDLGCGTGNYSIALARDGWQVRAFDLSPKMLERARAKAEAAVPGSIRFQRANFNRPLPIEDAAARHALCIAALQCVGEMRFFNEVFRVLQPGGCFFGVYRDNEMHDLRPRTQPRREQATSGWRTMLAIKSRAGRTQLITHWTEATMRETLERAGLVVDAMEPFYRGTKLVIARRPEGPKAA
ncbi:MAG: methyltransferase domain-containing protein [Acidobacteriota bacterium]